MSISLSLLSLPPHREGDAGGGEGEAGQHSGQEGQEEGEREADGGGSQTGLSAEEEGAQGCWDRVRECI